MTRIPPVLLLSELFPPAVGGSAVLFDNIYSRLPQGSVQVLTDDAFSGTRSASGLPLHRRRLRTPWWGLSHPRGLLHHARVAMQIRRLARNSGQDTVVHCGRILPEGVAARMAQLSGGPAFTCWAHGEDLATARSSRELTWVTEWVLRGAAGAFANSQNTRQFLTQFGIDGERVAVVYPGVDCERFTPDVDGSGIRRRYGVRDELVVLSVGRLQARKGHDVAIRAIDAMSRAGRAVKYLIAGDGEERASLEQLVRDRGLGDRVVFLGEVSDAELPAHYAACDIFLLANRVEKGDFEGFGIVFLEAAACGKPVVGGASGGVVEAVEHGRTGLLVDAAQVDEVVAALSRLADAPDLRREMGEAGRRRAVESFSWEAAAATVHRLHRLNR